MIAASNTLSFRDLPPNSRYVRAEVVGVNDTVVYTQAFPVRPVGDVDGDYDVNDQDGQLCDSLVDPSDEAGRILVAACLAATP